MGYQQTQANGFSELSSAELEMVSGGWGEVPPLEEVPIIVVTGSRANDWWTSMADVGALGGGDIINPSVLELEVEEAPGDDFREIDWFHNEVADFKNYLNGRGLDAEEYVIVETMMGDQRVIFSFHSDTKEGFIYSLDSGFFDTSFTKMFDITVTGGSFSEGRSGGGGLGLSGPSGTFSFSNGFQWTFEFNDD